MGPDFRKIAGDFSERGCIIPAHSRQEMLPRRGILREIREGPDSYPVPKAISARDTSKGRFWQMWHSTRPMEPVEIKRRAGTRAAGWPGFGKRVAFCPAVLSGVKVRRHWYVGIWVVKQVVIVSQGKSTNSHPAYPGNAGIFDIMHLRGVFHRNSGQKPTDESVNQAF